MMSGGCSSCNVCGKEACSKCHGYGWIQVDSGDGLPRMVPCPKCNKEE